MSDKDNIWCEGSNATYEPEKTAHILESFNDAIHALYAIGDEDRFIFQALNTTSYAEKEYKRLVKDLGVDLTDVANTLELMRNVVFGDSLDWNQILVQISPKEEK